MSSTRLSATLQNMLDEHFRLLDDLTVRLQHVASTHKELVRVTSEKPFRIHGYAAWMGIVSTRDMVIIDLCSWTNGLSEPGGFFGQFRGDDLKALSWKWPGHGVDGWRRDAFGRLFPGAAGRDVPNQGDIEALRSKLRKDFKRLNDDRNQLRAHRHEKESKKGTAQALAFEDTAAYLKFGGALMRDVYCLATHASHSTLDFRARADDADAQDVVDLVLLGTLGWIFGGDPSKGHDEKLMYWQRREAHYDRLHVAYAAMGSPTKYAFNDAEVAMTLPSSK
jgi:hypothetical protein